MIKALIFDLDNTLIDRQRAFREMLVREFSKITNDSELIKSMTEDIVSWDRNGEISRDITFNMWKDKYGFESPTPAELSKSWSNESGKVAYLYPDVRDTLTQLKKKYKLAVLSNGNKISQRRKLETIAIYDLLDYSLVSGEFDVNKPDPKIFHYVCEQLGLNPNECAYIGDNYRIDVEGSKNAGLYPVYVCRNEENSDTFKILDNVPIIFNICDLLNIF